MLPVPLAAGLYGVLLGLGFTTFILTFAVWALAGGQRRARRPGARRWPSASAFGAGRALPVIVLAPVAATDRGSAAHAAMAERPRDPARRCAPPTRSRSPPARPRWPRVGRAARSAPRVVAAQARPTRASDGEPRSPSSAPAARRPAPRRRRRVALPGRDPAVGAGLVGLDRDGEPDRARRRRHADPGRRYPRRGAGASRSAPAGSPGAAATAQLVAQPRDSSAAPRVVAPRAPADAARPPALAGDTAALPPRRAAPRIGIRLLDLDNGARTTLRSRARGALLLNPSALGGRGCSTCARPTAASSCGSGRCGRARLTRDRVLYGDRADRPPRRGRRARATATPAQGHTPPALAPRRPPASPTRCGPPRSRPDAAYVTRLRQRTGAATAVADGRVRARASWRPLAASPRAPAAARGRRRPRRPRPPAPRRRTGPVATATTRTPSARAQAMSRGVSPITTVRSRGHGGSRGAGAGDRRQLARASSASEPKPPWPRREVARRSRRARASAARPARSCR